MCVLMNSQRVKRKSGTEMGAGRVCYCSNQLEMSALRCARINSTRRIRPRMVMMVDMKIKHFRDDLEIFGLKRGKIKQKKSNDKHCDGKMTKNVENAGRVRGIGQI